jgi:hypothetical protein
VQIKKKIPLGGQAMTIATFSLPVDIPWQRLCVSDDMIDPTVCDRKFPYRWRSSVAVFSYEPPKDQQTYDDMIVSYLKVACTITSFQPNPEEVGLKDRRVDSYWNTPLLIEDYLNKVSKAYPCFGAILEVGVAPAVKTIDGEEIPLTKYPYFMDFEPKKREVYELVTDTGENMSRSLDAVSVGKSSTTTGTHEKLDILNGISVGANATVAGTGGGGSISVQGQWGTRDINQQESSDVRTTDQSKEQRENFSHTTQLTQMFQQLNSYHLGTNRAVFFVLPRPHIIQDPDTPLTFINGPRKLEGIQEFFLVVMRPKEIEKICVEAYLETAHVGQVATYGNTFEKSTATTPTLSLSITADESTVKLKTKSGFITYTAPPGSEIDTSKGPGYEIHILKNEGGGEIKKGGGHGNSNFCAVTALDQSHLVLTGKVVTGLIKDHPSDTNEPSDPDEPHHPPVVKPNPHPGVNPVDGALEANATVHLRKGQREQTGSASGLYITGRGVCCCQAPDPQNGNPDDSHHAGDHDRRLLSESVLWEQIMPLNLDVPVGDVARMRVADANRVRAEIDRMIVRSVNDPDRYAAGTVSFAETQLVALSVADLISVPGHPDDHPLENIKGLDSKLISKIASRAPNISRSDLLFMSHSEQKDRFDLSPDEVRQLRRALIGLEGPVPEPKDRWNPPGRSKTEYKVPNVVGLPLAEAEAALEQLQFLAGEVAYEDSALPGDTTLSQSPEAEAMALGGTRVDLIVATGLSVRIPDLVGVTLSQALVMLRDAGLKSEPEINFASSGKYPGNQVIQVSPEMRSYVTPHASVVIQVSGKS